jgi:hypothetical protein
MHSDILGFRYATSRWLALIGLSLVTFLLILKYFPSSAQSSFDSIAGKRNEDTHTISIHAYMKSTQTTSHTQAFE